MMNEIAVGKLLLLLVVTTLAIGVYVMSPPRIQIPGSTRMLSTALVLFVGGISLLVMHVSVDAAFGVDWQQTWRGLMMDDISLLPPLGYSLLISGVVFITRSRCHSE